MGGNNIIRKFKEIFFLESYVIRRRYVRVYCVFIFFWRFGGYGEVLDDDAC